LTGGGALRPEKAGVQAFYDGHGWTWDEKSASFEDGATFDDLRECSASYRSRANDRVRTALAGGGRFLLDAASGAIQYDDYRRFSEAYRRRVCVDLSRRGLAAARQRIGGHGLFVQADATRLPFAKDVFDAVVSLHTLYHVPADEQHVFLRELVRVLRPAKRAVVVSTWDKSPWDKALRAPGALGRRLARMLGRGPVPSTHATAEGPSLYFEPTRRSWLEHARPNDARLATLCWRSVSVDLLRRVPGRPWGTRLLRALSWAEDLCPRLLGRLGQYPLFVFEKDR